MNVSTGVRGWEGVHIPRKRGGQTCLAFIALWGVGVTGKTMDIGT